MAQLEAWQDPKHPTNKLRPHVRCRGCGVKGCVGEHWGPWCFSCNVERIGRINVRMAQVRERLGLEDK
jgi:hypothetical protein